VQFVGVSLCIGSLSLCVYLEHSLAVVVKCRIFGGCILHSTGSHRVGVVFTTPAMIRMVELSCTSILKQYALFSHTGTAYLFLQWDFVREGPVKNNSQLFRGGVIC